MTSSDISHEGTNKRGRPICEEACRNIHTIRLDDNDEALLSHLRIESDDTASDIMRKALRMYYRIESRKW